ncbi:MAG: hypothetical protein HIU88_10185 [Acidobacteria bacterium]|nr:hypothetical protein [Acidobacteriota bacterium]
MSHKTTIIRTWGGDSAQAICTRCPWRGDLYSVGPWSWEFAEGEAAAHERDA